MIRKIISSNPVIYFSIFISIVFGIFTLYSFSNPSLFRLNENNIKFLIILNILIAIFFFILIGFKILNLFKKKNFQNTKTNIDFLKHFILVTILPAFFVAFFSLLLFNLGIEKWFDKKINEVVSNSVEVAKNYLEENQNSIKAEISAMSSDLSRNINIYHNNKNIFQNYFDQQSIFRKIAEAYLINNNGDIILSTSFTNKEQYFKPIKTFMDMAEKGQTVLISDANKNQTNGLVKLDSIDNLYLYVVRYVDPETVKFLKQTGESSSFYYTLKDNNFGLQVTFATVYLIIVTSLLLLSSNYAINVANKISQPINKLILAVAGISKGHKPKLVAEDENEEFKKLYSTFNEMSEQIEDQKQKIILNERYKAWEIVARKLAHEIKNPLTPILLSIDQIKEKFLNQDIKKGNGEFKNYLDIISRQVSDIGKLANEFSDFARMPSAEKRENNLRKLIEENISLMKLSAKDIDFDFNYQCSSEFYVFDRSQISRVIINILKNSIEAIDEKKLKSNFKGNIKVLVVQFENFIKIKVEDNGIGFKNIELDTALPLQTTKKTGSGLGLSIVNKILDQHNGNLKIFKSEEGAKVEINIGIN